MARLAATLVACLFIAYAARAALHTDSDAPALSRLEVAVEVVGAIALAAAAHLAAAELEAEDLGCYRRLLCAAAVFGCLVALLLAVDGHLTGTAEEIAAIALYTLVFGISALPVSLSLALCLC